MSRPNLNKRTKCGVLGCYNSSTIHEVNGISYFKLPKDRKRAKQWLQAIRRKPAGKVVVCEAHFESHLVTMVRKRKRLALHAVPTLQLPDPALVEWRRSQWRVGRVLVLHRATQAPDACPDPAPDSDADPPPDIDIFVKEETLVESPPPPTADAFHDPERDGCVKQEPPEDNSQDLETFFRLSQTYLNPELAKCIEIQLLLKNEMKAITEGNLSDDKLLLYALKLHFAFPQTYKVMRQTLGLPSVIDMRRLFQPLTWEMNELWARGLMERFRGTSRECAVCVARVPLRPALAYDALRDRLVGLDERDGQQWPYAASHAVVVHARGVHARWRQPLSCCLLAAKTTSEELWFWIDTVITKLFQVGLKIRALVTDYDDHFVNSGRPLSPQMPYFTVNDRQIYRLYDCTQMMIAFRDCLMHHNIAFGDRTASWNDVVKLFENDIPQKVKLAPGLTVTHVRPERYGRMGRAALALGALSPAVAGALAIAVERGALPAAALGTAQLLNSVSALYECLHKEELNTKPISGEKDRLKVLKEMLQLFGTLSPVDKMSSQPESDAGVLAALAGSARAALALAERARVAGYATLPMRAFNNDPLHEFIGRLQKGSSKPTSKQVCDAFRKSFVLNIVRPLMNSTNEDYGSFLVQAGFVRGVAAQAGLAEPAPPALLVPRAHWAPLLEESFGAREPPLLARRLLEQVLVQHASCEAARGYCAGAKLPLGLLQLRKRLGRRFEALARAPSPTGVLRPLLAHDAGLPFLAPCACFPVLYLKTLYLRFRVQNLIQYNNKRLRKPLVNDYMVNVF